LRVWDRIKNFFRRKGDARSAVASTLFDRFDKWFSPTNIFTRLNAHALASNETIFAAVSRLSNSIGSMPVKLLDKNFRLITNHRVADMVMNQPNPNQTSFDFFRTMEAIRNTSGNAYALKDYDENYQVRALRILDPGRVEPVIEKNTRELWYEIKPEDGTTYYAHNLEVIHVKHIHGFGYKGISPIDVLKGTSEFDRKIREKSLDQIESAIAAGFILKLAGSINKEKRDEILNNFKKFYKDNGGVLIQEMGVEIDPIERRFIDTKLFDVEKITRARVANVYNLPLHLLGELSEAPAGAVEQMDLGYVQGTLVPIVRQYEQEMNRKLLTPVERQRGWYFKFNTNALLRGDMKTRGEFYFKGIRSGWFKPNEVRALEDLPPEKGGDVLYMSKDLFPIGDERGIPNEGIE
jgi:HK97 family phage portal protein